MEPYLSIREVHRKSHISVKACFITCCSVVILAYTFRISHSSKTQLRTTFISTAISSSKLQYHQINESYRIRHFIVHSKSNVFIVVITWWRHQKMEPFSALLAICAGNSPVPGEFPAQRPVTRSFDVFFDLRLNKRLSKQSWGWWFETLSCPLWRHCHEVLWSCKWHV